MYIELLSSVLIGVAAVMVAYASYTVSEQQLLLAEISLEPHFHVETTYIFDPKMERYVESELYVFNSGAPINNSDFSVKSFLVVEHESNAGRRETHIPIIGYYPAQFNHQAPLGKLVTFKGHLNNENFNRLYREFLDEETKKKYGFVDINLEHITTVDYRNRKGVAGKAYFFNRELVAKDMVINRLNQHEGMFSLEIEGLTAEQLMNKIPEYENRITNTSSRPTKAPLRSTFVAG